MHCLPTQPKVDYRNKEIKSEHPAITIPVPSIAIRRIPSLVPVAEGELLALDAVALLPVAVPADSVDWLGKEVASVEVAVDPVEVERWSEGAAVPIPEA
jgi:hypothetical protein